MPPINFIAVAMAFAAEFVVDWLSQMFLLVMFAGDRLRDQMSQDEYRAMVQNVLDTTALEPWAMACGLATTVGGAYLAARIAKRIPYYHGLAMGIVSIVYIVVSSLGSFTWQTWLGILVTIPLSLYGAHLARRQMPAEMQ